MSERVQADLQPISGRLCTRPYRLRRGSRITFLVRNWKRAGRPAGEESPSQKRIDPFREYSRFRAVLLVP